MGKETNPSLHTFTELTIFDFLLTIFSPHNQFLAFKDLYIQTKLRNKLLKQLYKTI